MTTQITTATTDNTMPQQELLFLMRVLSAFSLFSARCRYKDKNEHVSSSEAWRKLLRLSSLVFFLLSREG